MNFMILIKSGNGLFQERDRKKEGSLSSNKIAINSLTGR